MNRPFFFYSGYLLVNSLSLSAIRFIFTFDTLGCRTKEDLEIYEPSFTCDWLSFSKAVLSFRLQNSFR